MSAVQSGVVFDYLACGGLGVLTHSGIEEASCPLGHESCGLQASYRSATRPAKPRDQQRSGRTRRQDGCKVLKRLVLLAENVIELVDAYAAPRCISHSRLPCDLTLLVNVSSLV